MTRRIDLAELRAWLDRRIDPATGMEIKFWPFGDGPEMSAELLRLVLAGTKTATADLLWHYEDLGEDPPRPGQLSVVTDWYGDPRAVLETTEVTVRPYDEVDAAFARDEGEGDRSLEYWRRVHWDYYARQCAGTTRVPDAKMPIVCERFRLLLRIEPGSLLRIPRGSS
jgi:uncharacterized protein YhfF